MVYTLGESLLDIIFHNEEKPVPKAGGGMLNTAVSLGRSGIEVSLISELGDDGTAKTILDFLSDNGVAIKYIKKYYRQNTSVALAYLDENKKPSFSIYKSYPKKRRLIAPDEISKKDILVFGSLYSIDPLIREELKPILIRAKRAGALLIYDPNIRRHKLDDPIIRQALNENLAMANIIKASDEDLINIFGEDTEEGYYKQVRNVNPDAIFIITKGGSGVCGFLGNERFDFPANKIDVVSTIGAGDAFNAGLVFRTIISDLNKKPLTELSKNDFIQLLDAGQQYSAVVCKGMDNYVGNGFTLFY